MHPLNLISFVILSDKINPLQDNLVNIIIHYKTNIIKFFVYKVFSNYIINGNCNY